MARLVPYAESPRPRVPGRWRGRLRIAADFDVTPDDLVEAFEGS